MILVRFLAVFVLLTPLVSLASPREAGNGGDGIKIDGKVYVLDLVEVGVEADPYFDPNIKPDPDFTERLKKAVAVIDAPVGLLSQKLAEVFKVDHLFATFLLKVIELYDWRLVSRKLVDVSDDDDSPLQYSREDLVQLANRSGYSIRISRESWRLLDDKNKVALIIHEATYAMIQPVEDKIDEKVTYLKQISSRAREVTGYLFTKELLSRGLAGLIGRVGNEFPRVTKGLGGIQEKNHEIFYDPNLYFVAHNKDFNGHSKSIYITGRDTAETVEKTVTKFCQNNNDDVQKENLTHPYYIEFGFRSNYATMIFNSFLSETGTKFWMQPTWGGNAEGKDTGFKSINSLKECIATTAQIYLQSKPYLEKFKY